MSTNNYPFLANVQVEYSDNAVNSLNPGMEYGGTELSAIYYEDREVNGVMYRVQNATWNKFAQSWSLINPALPAYGTALLANGTMQFLSSNAGVSPFTTWTVPYSTTATGVSTISPTTSTIPAASDFSGLGQFNVKHYGALGNGVADDTAAFVAAAAALTAAGGGVLMIPNGNYFVSNVAAAFSGLNGVYVKGNGINNTTITQTAVTKGVFSFTSCTGCGVSDVGITYQNPGTTQPCVTFTLSVYAYLTNVNIGNPYISVQIAGSQQVFLTRVCSSQRATQSDGVQLLNSGSTTNTEIHLTDCVFGSTGGNTAVGLHLSQVNGINITACDFLSWNVGCQIDPAGSGAANTNVFNVFMQDAQFDGSGSYALWVQPSSSGHVYYLTFVNCWFNGAGQAGVNLTGTGSSIIDTVRFNGCFIAFNGTYGAVVGTAIRTSFTACTIVANNKTLSGTPGILVQTTASDTQITGNQIGNNSIFTATQSVGITVNATPTNLVIVGNDLTGNTSTAINLSGANPGATTKISQNLGFNPLGAPVSTPAVPGSTTPVTNTTGCDVMVYLSGGTISAIAIAGLAGTFTTLGVTTGPVWLPAGGQIKLTYSAAPGWAWSAN